MTSSKTDLHIALAQLNPHLGDVNANCDKLLQMRARAAEQNCQILLTPEMYLSGYPADDLVLRADFMDRVECRDQETSKLIRQSSTTRRAASRRTHAF